MEKIFKIYRDDLKSITSNWAAAIIIMALIVLPSFYAWFNIKASWDPYGNTKGLPIAVVNEDKGTVIRGKSINIGKEVINSLKNNNSLGWKFVNAPEADKGVKRGKYFASITISKDFSEKIATVLSDNPEKPQLTYVVNEKINAIAPKITAKGATGMKEQITKNFIKTANGVIFDIFNELGIELQKNLPSFEKLKSMIFWLNDHLSEAETIMNTAAEDAQQAEKIVADLQSFVTEVEGTIVQARGLSKKVNDFLDSNQEALANLAPTVKQNLIYLEQISAGVEETTGILLSTTASVEEKDSALNDGIHRLSTMAKIESLFINLFDGLNGLGQTTVFDSEISRLSQQKTDAQTLLQNLQSIQGAAAPAEEMLQKINQRAAAANTALGELVNNYDAAIAPKFAKITQTAKALPLKANEFFTNADETLPRVKKILNDAAGGIAIGRRDLALLQQDFPAIKQKITELAAKIREFEQTEDILDIIDLLRNDVKKESDFFAEPVLLKEKRLYPIPNYGSAMSPFFTTLSLWVGATLLISLISVEVHGLPTHYRPNHVYLGRFLTFLTIALCQSLIVTLGDIFLLKTYVADKLWFILFGLLCSGLFMLIIYTLVSILGNVGKGAAIILLVLQVSAAGGTFPIQVMPAFFQKINPFLPFTYAISLMREATGGILWEIVKRDLAVFLGIAIVTLLFGLVLKEPIEKYGGGLKRKATESRLLH